MKKLFIYFVLVSSLFCGISRASSQYSTPFTKEQLDIIATEDPYQRISRLFEKSFKNNDYTQKEWIVRVPRSIYEAYEGRPDLQLKAIDAWGRCMRNQKINGKRKYTEKDIEIVVGYSKHKLNLN